MSKRPKVIAEFHTTVDLTDELDDWTDDDLRDFAAGEDDEGYDILKTNNAPVLGPSEMDLDWSQLRAYAEARLGPGWEDSDREGERAS